MPRPRNRSFDINLIDKQLLYGNTKKKICDGMPGLTLYKLNAIIDEHELLTKLNVSDEYLKLLLSLNVTSEKQTWGFNYINTLFRLQRIRVPAAQLKRVLRELDPESSQNRWALNINRIPQTYTAGPMHVWCIDAYCKLSAFGIYIYHVIDFATSAILNIHVMRNIRPESVWQSYQGALTMSHGISPTIVRMDAGTETVYIKMHQAYRMGIHKLIVGPSTGNVMAERGHRWQFEKCGWFIKQCLVFLCDQGLLDINSAIDINSVWEVFGFCLQQKLVAYQKNSNMRKRRNQPRRNKPGGVPMEEFNSFFGRNDFENKNFEEGQQTKWRLADPFYNQYREDMKNYLSVHGSVPIEVPNDLNYAKTQMLSGTDVKSEFLNDAGIQLRNQIISMFLPNVSGCIEAYRLMFHYVCHKIITEEILSLSQPHIFTFNDQKTHGIRQELRNWLYKILNIN